MLQPKKNVNLSKKSKIILLITSLLLFIVCTVFYIVFAITSKDAYLHKENEKTPIKTIFIDINNFDSAEIEYELKKIRNLGVKTIVINNLGKSELQENVCNSEIISTEDKNKIYELSEKVLNEKFKLFIGLIDNTNCHPSDEEYIKILNNINKEIRAKDFYKNPLFVGWHNPTQYQDKNFETLANDQKLIYENLIKGSNKKVSIIYELTEEQFPKNSVNSETLKSISKDNDILITYIRPNFNINCMTESQIKGISDFSDKISRLYKPENLGYLLSSNTCNNMQSNISITNLFNQLLVIKNNEANISLEYEKDVTAKIFNNLSAYYLDYQNTYLLDNFNYLITPTPLTDYPDGDGDELYDKVITRPLNLKSRDSIGLSSNSEVTIDLANNLNTINIVGYTEGPKNEDIKIIVICDNNELEKFQINNNSDELKEFSLFNEKNANTYCKQIKLKFENQSPIYISEVEILINKRILSF